MRSPRIPCFARFLENLSTRQRDTLREQYAATQDRYVRRRDSGIAQLMLQRLHTMIFEDGGYTEEDFAEDNATYGVELGAGSLSVDAAVEYTLDGKDLVVRVPLSDIEITNDLELQRVRLLPYLMSAKAGEEGYLLVPDGSGAILEFDNSRRTASNYRARVYGSDALQNITTYERPRPQVTLPMAAIQYDDHAIIGMIEEGQDLAEIVSEVSGKTDEYNKVGFEFNIIDIEQVQSVGASTVTLPRYSRDIYRGDIAVRYRMVEAHDVAGDDLTYVGLAEAYRTYLTQTGRLTPQSLPDRAPLHVELLGAIEKKQFFLGIPYHANIELTSYREAEGILSDLIGSGVGEVHAELVGMTNGGMRASDWTSVRPERKLGGARGFEQLLGQASDRVTVYPTAMLQEVYTRKGLSAREDLARMLSGEYARVPYLNHLTQRATVDSRRSPYLISPHTYEAIVGDFVESAGDLGIRAVSVPDLGQRLIADYNRDRDIGRYRAIDLTEGALGQLAEGMDRLLLSNPNLYAWKYADGMTDLPIGSSGQMSFDYAIPFVQLVLDGVMPLSTARLNHAALEDPGTLILEAIEYRSAPKFALMDARDRTLVNTLYDGILVADYRRMKDPMLEIYEGYRTVYEAVGDQAVRTHEVLSDTLRRITYADGSEIILNYGTTDAVVDGTTVPAVDYVLTQ